MQKVSALSAKAFLLAVAVKNGRESGYEGFFITAPDTVSNVLTIELSERYWKDAPMIEGKSVDDELELPMAYEPLRTEDLCEELGRVPYDGVMLIARAS